MTVGFAAPLVSALAGYVEPAGRPAPTLASLGPTLVAMTFLTLGAMVASPFAMAMVPRFGRDRLIATYGAGAVVTLRHLDRRGLLT
jgi:hypothetical protein